MELIIVCYILFSLSHYIIIYNTIHTYTHIYIPIVPIVTIIIKQCTEYIVLLYILLIDLIYFICKRQTLFEDRF